MSKLDQIKALIEEARREGELNNDAARAASLSLELEGDEAMLACRVFQGPDPAMIEKVCFGEVSEPVQKAHRMGPGSLTGPEKDHWLFLVAMSADEAQENGIVQNLSQLAAAASTLKAYEKGELPAEHRAAMILDAEQRIKETPFVAAPAELFGEGIEADHVRLYTSDLGFAAAYWSGVPYAAVLGTFNGEPYVALGSDQASGAPSLEDLGLRVDKPLGTHFGIIEDPARLAAIQAALDSE